MKKKIGLSLSVLTLFLLLSVIAIPNGVFGVYGNFLTTASAAEAQKSIESCTITISPFLVVKDGDTTLVEDTDYTVKYQTFDGDIATTAIIGMGNYTGVYVESHILRTGCLLPNISDCTIKLSETSFVYDGTAKTPTVEVYLVSSKLEKDKNYTVAYSSNINAGTASVTLTAIGSNITGSVTKTFTIAPKAIDAVTVTANNQNLDFSDISKNIIMKYGINTLNAYKDYVYTYSYDSQNEKDTLYIMGIGNYTGILKKENVFFTCKGVLITTDDKFSSSTERPVIVAVAGVKKAVVKWSSIKYAEGYQLRMSKTKNGKYSVIKTLGNKKKSFTKVKLKSGNTYYFKVRAYIMVPKELSGEKKQFGNESEVVKIKVK